MDVTQKAPQKHIDGEALRNGGVTSTSTVTNPSTSETTPERAEARPDGYGVATKAPELPSAALAGSGAQGPAATRMAMLTGQHKDARSVMTQVATAAAVRVALEHADKPFTGSHPLLEKFGEGLGKFLGVVVTEALALVPSWNKPVLDANGKPVESVDDGVTKRIGDYDIKKRHEEVVGPKIAEYVKTLAPGALHDLLEGLGIGASAAPGISYDIEAQIAKALGG